MFGKIGLLVAILFCVGAYIMNPDSAATVFRKLFNIIFNTSAKENSLLVFSKEELSLFKGQDGGKVYLAIVGHVYDVSKGRKHYGPGGGYEFFAGIDGSKAYVTGHFDKEGLIDDISDLSPSEVLALENWKLFYDKDYTLVGKVEGSFYDKNGEELPMLDLYRNKLKEGILQKEMIEKDNQQFPPCNSEWSQANGGRVWCSTRSGGVLREWVGVPRMYYIAGSTKPRCACVKTSGPPSHDPDRLNHNNKGDLDNPNLSLYPNCEELSDSCPIP